MKNKNCMSLCVIALCVAGCNGLNNGNAGYMYNDTPTVDYVESLDVNKAPLKDSFLNQLAMNYRSYAIYNAQTSGYPDIGELFAQKAVSAFSGETPYPESLDNWIIDSDAERFEISSAYNKLVGQLKPEVIQDQPTLSAEAQAKFDCWISAAASAQNTTAQECKKRFNATMKALDDCTKGKKVAPTTVKSENLIPEKKEEKYYPETYRLNSMSGSMRAREGIVIVNNVSMPSYLIQPVPVPQQQQQAEPIIIRNNIYGLEQQKSGNVEPVSNVVPSDNEEIPEIGTEYVSRDEFINMMMAMRSELAEINKRLDNMAENKDAVAPEEKTIIKVQQIPLEPRQHVMEEIFEIRFDFNQSTIKPEYEDVIRKLVATTQSNKNIKVSVVGHTDTSGSSAYNYALGGRRAEAVQKMLIEYGIPASQIIAVSAGEEDLKVQTPNNTPNAENRRVRVVKEVHYTEPAKPLPLLVEEYVEEEAGDCADCGQEEPEFLIGTDE